MEKEKKTTEIIISKIWNSRDTLQPVMLPGNTILVLRDREAHDEIINLKARVAVLEEFILQHYPDFSRVKTIGEE